MLGNGANLVVNVDMRLVGAHRACGGDPVVAVRCHLEAALGNVAIEPDVVVPDWRLRHRGDPPDEYVNVRPPWVGRCCAPAGITRVRG